MPTDYSRGKIGLFWDVEDFPVPEGRRIRDIIDDVLPKKGYIGEVSIKAYGESETNPFPAEDGEFTYVHKRDKYWRLNKMLIDIGWWAVENTEPHLKPANLMVVAKDIKEFSVFLAMLQNLSGSSYNVILVLPDVIDEEVPLPHVDLMWRWSNLLVGGEPMPEGESLALVAELKRRHDFGWRIRRHICEEGDRCLFYEGI